MLTNRPLSPVLLLLCLVNSSARSDGPTAAAWTQWRGPQRNGIVRKDQALPSKLSGDSLQQKWRVELGPSYSGPLVVGDRVFVTEAKDRKWEVVRALDRNSGKQVWEAQWEGTMRVPFFAGANGSWIRSTPAYDDGRLFVAGMRDVLVCIDAKTGKQQWRVDFVKSLGTSLPAFGFVCSPLVVGDHVFVQAGASLAKLDKRTGEIVWRTLKDKGGMGGSAFSSPSLATLQGKRQLLVQTRTTLAGVDLEKGNVLWSKDVPAFRGMNILTPSALGDSVFTSSYGGGTFLFDVGKKKGKFTVAESWKAKQQGYMSSPVFIDGHAYLHLRNQRFTCIDLSSGEAKWTTRPYGKYWSLVASGDGILALDQRGELLLIRANTKKFELLDSHRVSDQETWAHLAICGSELFVRELKAMTVFTFKND